MLTRTIYHVFTKLCRPCLTYAWNNTFSSACRLSIIYSEVSALTFVDNFLHKRPDIVCRYTAARFFVVQRLSHKNAFWLSAYVPHNVHSQKLQYAFLPLQAKKVHRCLLPWTQRKQVVKRISDDLHTCCSITVLKNDSVFRHEHFTERIKRHIFRTPLRQELVQAVLFHKFILCRVKILCTYTSWHDITALSPTCFPSSIRVLYRLILTHRLFDHSINRRFISSNDRH